MIPDYEFKQIIDQHIRAFEEFEEALCECENFDLLMRYAEIYFPNYDIVIHLLNRALNIQPGNINALHKLVEVYLNATQYENARLILDIMEKTHSEASLTLDAKRIYTMDVLCDPVKFIELGKVLLSRPDFPNKVDLYIDIGTTYDNNLQNYRAAQKYLKKALEINKHPETGKLINEHLMNIAKKVSK